MHLILVSVAPEKKCTQNSSKSSSSFSQCILNRIRLSTKRWSTVALHYTEAVEQQQLWTSHEGSGLKLPLPRQTLRAVSTWTSCCTCVLHSCPSDFSKQQEKIKIWSWKDTVQMFAFFFFLRNRSTINLIFQISWMIKQTIGFCLHEKLHFLWVDANVASAIIKMYFKLQVYNVFSFWQYGKKNHLLTHFFTCSLDNYGSIYYNSACQNNLKGKLLQLPGKFHRHADRKPSLSVCFFIHSQRVLKLN